MIANVKMNYYYEMKILVTGGCGFIGAAVTSRLIEDGHTIVSMHRSPPHYFDSKRFCTSFENYQSDKLTSKYLNFDALIVLHSSTIALKKQIDSQLASNSILDSSFSTLIRSFQEKTIIFASSGGALYSEPQLELPIDETMSIQTKTKYAFEKFQVERLIEDLGLKYKSTNSHIVRLANVYGTDDRKIGRGLVTTAVNAGLTGELLKVYGTEVIRDYIYIDDVVELFADLVLKKSHNLHINAGTGTGTSNAEVVSIVSKFLGVEIKTEIHPPLESQTKYNVLNSNLAQHLYGWRAKIQLNKGIEQMLRRCVTERRLNL